MIIPIFVNIICLKSLVTIFGEIIESIYPGEEPVEGPLNIFRADKSRIMSAYDTIAKSILKRDFYGHNAGENLNE